MGYKKRLVLIEWADSRQPTPGWERIADIAERTYCVCQSVGWMIQDNQKVKVLAANVADAGDEMQAMGIVTIPTACILAIKPVTSSYLRPASKRKRRQT
jgi:hypothetical protein